MYSPLISIVIPVFNRENTLHYCVESVLNQDYGNWELLLIDDGSTDGSAEICQSFVVKDGRVKYVHQVNQGAGPARNHGLKLAKGEWITFVDSDDAILPNHLSQLQKYGEGNDLVMVNHCTANLSNGRLEKKSDYWKGIENAKVSGNKDILRFLYITLHPYETYNYCCWDKFFKTSVIRNNNICFPTDVPTGQDMHFVISYFKYTENFYFSKEGTYAQTPMGNEGIEHLAFKLRPPKEYFHCHLRNYENLKDLYAKSNVEEVREYAAHYVLTDTFERSFLRYTEWRNRRIVGKREIIEFIRHDFLPVINENKDYLDCVSNSLYSSHLKQILEGKENAVYNFWFRKKLKNWFIEAIRRRL